MIEIIFKNGSSIKASKKKTKLKGHSRKIFDTYSIKKLDEIKRGN